MFGNVIEICPKFYVLLHDLKVKVTDLKFLYKSFVLFFFTISVFCKAFNGFESCLAR